MFFELAHDSEHCATADSWSIQTHRSRVGSGGVSPRWGTDEDNFSFRFAIPTHHVHLRSSSASEKSLGSEGSIENAWHSGVTDESKKAAHGLEALFQAMYTGPPILLNCSVFHKNKLMQHHFMGKGRVRCCVCVLTWMNLTLVHSFADFVDLLDALMLCRSLSTSSRLVTPSIAGSRSMKCPAVSCTFASRCHSALCARMWLVFTISTTSRTASPVHKIGWSTAQLQDSCVLDWKSTPVISMSPKQTKQSAKRDW